MFNILEKLENTTGSKDKLAILKASDWNLQLKQLFDITYNFRRKYYIKKFEISSIGPGASFDEFVNIVERLQRREITGHEGLNVVETFFQKCNEQQQRWFSRALKRDLRIGCDIDTLNKAGVGIPLFEVQLATDYFKCKRTEQMLAQGLTPSPKFDGFRCLAIGDGETINLYSRNGEVYQNFPSIIKALSDSFGNQKFVFDGEVMSDDFNAMQRSAFAKVRKSVVGDVKYHIFDCIPFEEWDSQTFKLKFTERIKLRDKTFEGVINDRLVLVEHEPLVFDEEQIIILRNKYIAMGYEGIIVNPDIPYYCGRSSNKMLKVKIRKSMDCKIIGFYKGREGKKHENVLGGFIVMQDNNVDCKVGGGFEDSDREYIWNNQSEFLGKIIEVEYQELSKEDQRMRFNSFFRFRDDKS